MAIAAFSRSRGSVRSVRRCLRPRNSCSSADPSGELIIAATPPRSLRQHHRPGPFYNYGVMGEIKNAGTAAVLSAILPGLGQFYNGDFLRGIFWLIVTPGLWIGSGGLLGWICHVIAAITGHRRARKKNQTLTESEGR